MSCIRCVVSTNYLVRLAVGLPASPEHDLSIYKVRHHGMSDFYGCRVTHVIRWGQNELGGEVRAQVRFYWWCPPTIGLDDGGATHFYRKWFED